MNSRQLLVISILTLFGCNDHKSPNDKQVVVDSISGIIISNSDTTTPKKISRLKQVLDFPSIKYTSQFIQDIKEYCDFEIDNGPYSKQIEKISYYKKVK